jgi:hypothetical protein
MDGAALACRALKIVKTGRNRSRAKAPGGGTPYLPAPVAS